MRIIRLDPWPPPARRQLSHLADLVPSLVNDPRVSLVHFSADVKEEQPVFDYKLRRGLSTQRLGLTLLTQEGVLELLEIASGTQGGSRRGAE